MDKKGLQIITNLYLNQTAKIRRKAIELVEMIKRGVRQVFSPFLFSLYSGEIIQKSIEEITFGIKVNRIPTKNIRYVDNPILIA